MHLLFEGQLGLSTGVLGQSVFDIARVYIYVALDMFNIVPTVFLGLNKLLLFGTKIVTLFGQMEECFCQTKT
jgi:hypothetical protein